MRNLFHKYTHRERVFVVSFAHYIYEKLHITYITQKLNDQVAATLCRLFLIAFKKQKIYRFFTSLETLASPLLRSSHIRVKFNILIVICHLPTIIYVVSNSTLIAIIKNINNMVIYYVIMSHRESGFSTRPRG